MNEKPITMIINETKAKLVTVCNESGLTPFLLDLILQGIYSEIHYIAQEQALNEKAAYIKSLEDVKSDKQLKLEKDENKKQTND